MVDPVPVTIMPAARGDAAILAELHAASFDTGWDEQSFTRYLDQPSCLTLVAKTERADGAILGFVIARSAGVEADILTLSVVSEARCCGIGRSLINTLCADLADKGVQMLFLEVGERNHAAAAFYRAMGFEKAGVRKSYYRAASGNPRETASVLRLELRNP